MKLQDKFFEIYHNGNYVIGVYAMIEFLDSLPDEIRNIDHIKSVRHFYGIHKSWIETNLECNHPVGDYNPWVLGMIWTAWNMFLKEYPAFADYVV